jgi:hypothetical protein
VSNEHEWWDGSGRRCDTIDACDWKTLRTNMKPARTVCKLATVHGMNLMNIRRPIECYRFSNLLAESVMKHTGEDAATWLGIGRKCNALPSVSSVTSFNTS